jgi:CheY-like chemotaxis protein
LESVREACPDAVLLDISMDDMDGWATATAMRQAGYTQVPIVIVSANVFENRPDNLQAAQCQAFVDKPVMESQLLDTLATHLGLQWVMQALPPPMPALAVQAEAMADPLLGAPALPEDAAWELHRLARKGHVQALREALAVWAQQAPEHAAQWQALQALVERFDLDEVAARLAPSANTLEDPLDELQS